MASKTVSLGDIMEIQTSRGFGYAQYIHDDPRYGACIRVFEGLHESRPSVEQILTTKVRYTTFLPVKHSVRHGLVEVIGNAAVELADGIYPMLLAGNRVNKKGSWWLWDGEKEEKIGPELTKEQRTYSIASNINAAMLRHWLETDWTPEALM